MSYYSSESRLYDMDLQYVYYNGIITGKKTVECRKDKGQWKDIKPGDVIRIGGFEKVHFVDVVNVIRYEPGPDTVYRCLVGEGYKNVIPDALNIKDAHEVYTECTLPELQSLKSTNKRHLWENSDVDSKGMIAIRLGRIYNEKQKKYRFLVYDLSKDNLNNVIDKDMIVSFDYIQCFIENIQYTERIHFIILNADNSIPDLAIFSEMLNEYYWKFGIEIKNIYYNALLGFTYYLTDYIYDTDEKLSFKDIKTQVEQFFNILHLTMKDVDTLLAIITKDESITKDEMDYIENSFLKLIENIKDRDLHLEKLKIIKKKFPDVVYKSIKNKIKKEYKTAYLGLIYEARLNYFLYSDDKEELLETF